MAEPTDVIVPILQRLQADLAAQGRKIDAIHDTLAEHGKALDKLQRHVIFHLGITTSHTADIEEISRRMEALETPT
jgi:hypothetical protein